MGIQADARPEYQRIRKAQVNPVQKRDNSKNPAKVNPYAYHPPTKCVKTVPHSGTRMISEALKEAGIEHFLTTSTTINPPKHLKVHVTHLFDETFKDYHDPVIVAVRDPLYMIGTWHFQIKSLSGPNNLKKIIPDRLVDCFNNWVERKLEWFRIEDEFHKLGEFIGTPVARPSIPRKTYSKGDYWVKQLIRERDKETLWKVLPLDFLARWVEKIPAYQTYDLWWME